MGTNQYHEPPEELGQEVRTFARMSTSLAEETEAIGWYVLRIAVEKGPEAIVIMEDSLGDEFKRFSIELEFLLQKTPRWLETAKCILFKGGDIVSMAGRGGGCRVGSVALSENQFRARTAG